MHHTRKIRNAHTSGRKVSREEVALAIQEWVEG
jgi:hypothetical protein